MTDGWWWWPHSSHAGVGRAVLFFPPAGADHGAARPLIDAASGIRLGVLRLPGRSTRSDEPADRRLASLVDQIVASIERVGGPPPILVGHSFGGMLAYAVCMALERAQLSVARLFAVATTAPPAWLAAIERESAPAIERRAERILELAPLPGALGADHDWVAHTRSLVIEDLSLARQLRCEPVSCPITAITPRGDRLLDATPPDRWRELTSAAVELVSVPGDHFFYRDRPELLTTRLRMECALQDGALELM